MNDDDVAILCPLGGDETNDCEDCVYSPEYHFVDGECVRRNARYIKRINLATVR